MAKKYEIRNNYNMKTLFAVNESMVIRACIIFLICMLYIKSTERIYVYAEAEHASESGYQVIYDENGSEIIAIYSDNSKENVLLLRGIHNKGTSNIAYLTTAYTLALRENTSDISYGRIGNYMTVEREESGIQDEISGDKILSYYKITIDDEFISNLFKIWKKETNQSGNEKSAAWWTFRNDLKNGLDIYMSNVFAVIKRDSSGNEIYRSGNYTNEDKGTGTLFYTLPAMLDAGKALNMFNEWSGKTQNYLPNYYDIRFKIKISFYKVNVEFTDQSGNVIADDETVADNYLASKTKGYFLPGGAAIIYLDNSAENVIINSKKYKLTTDKKAKFIGSNGNEAVFYGTSSLKFMYLTPGYGDCKIQVIYEELEDDEENTESPLVKERATNVTVIEETDTDISIHIGSYMPGRDIYDVSDAIPSTEELYISATGNKYLFKAELVTVTGIMNIPVTINKDYKVIWKDNEENYTVTEETEVEREFSYTYVKGYSLYGLSDITIDNNAFPGGSVNLDCTAAANNSSYVSFIKRGESDDDYMELPKEYYEGIYLEEETIGGEELEERPEIDMEAMREEIAEQADGKTGKIKICNDYFAFDGRVILSDVKTETNAPEIRIISYDREWDTVKTGIKIPAETKNDTYMSSAYITYVRKESYEGMGIRAVYEDHDIVPVNVFTPVYAAAITESDNKKYVQLISPDTNAIPVVIGDNVQTSDFYISVSNYGYHSANKGYGLRDYSAYVQTEAGKLQNRISFDRDVYIDVGNNYAATDDFLLKAGKWYTAGSERVRCYVPSYEQEGIMYAEVQSVAVNAGTDLYNKQYSANTCKNNYTAYDNEKFQISPRMYGISVYNICDYPVWENVFIKDNTLKLEAFAEDEWRKTEYDGTDDYEFSNEKIYEYGAGIYNCDGNVLRNEKYTFPTVAGSHPKYVNQGMYIPGSVIEFKIITTGNVLSDSSAYIEIEPSFFWINDKVREQVDLYYYIYEEGIRSLIKVGSGADLANKKSKQLNTYSYAHIKENAATREAVGENTIHYFAYALPADVLVVKKDYPITEYMLTKGISYNEDFFINEGFITVNFQITAYDDSGIPYISYMNEENMDNGYCCMWKTEGGGLTKEDYYGNNFEFTYGDFLVFDSSDIMSDYYRSEGMY